MSCLSPGQKGAGQGAKRGSTIGKTGEKGFLLGGAQEMSQGWECDWTWCVTIGRWRQNKLGGCSEEMWVGCLLAGLHEGYNLIWSTQLAVL